MVGDARSVTECTGRVPVAALRGPSARSFRPGKTPRKPAHRSRVLAARLELVPSTLRSGGAGSCPDVNLVAPRQNEVGQCGIREGGGHLSAFRDTTSSAPEVVGRRRTAEAVAGIRDSEAQKVEQVAQALLMGRRMGGEGSASKFSACPKKRKQRMRVPQTDRACDYCGTSSTAQWRSGPPDFPVLCNACGVRHRKGKLQIRGGLPFPQKALGCNLLTSSPLGPFPSLAPICTFQVPSSSKDSKIDITTPTSCLEVSKLGKRTRSGSFSGSSGQSGQAIVALPHTCGEATAQPPSMQLNKFLDNDYCFNLRWGTKRRRSGL